MNQRIKATVKWASEEKFRGENLLCDPSWRHLQTLVCSTEIRRYLWKLAAGLLTEGGCHRVQWGRYYEWKAEEEWEGGTRKGDEGIYQGERTVCATPHDMRYVLERGFQCRRNERRTDGQRAEMEQRAESTEMLVLERGLAFPSPYPSYSLQPSHFRFINKSKWKVESWSGPI